MLKIAAAVSIILLTFDNQAFAESARVNLTLQESIAIALKNNLELKVEEFNPILQGYELQKIYDGFGFSVGLRPNLRQNVSPTSTSFLSGTSILDEFSQNYDFYATQKLPTGGEISLNFENSIFNTNSTRADINPAIVPRLSLDLSHPLLKYAFNGFKRISIGKNNTLASQYRFKSRAIGIVSETQDAYWDLVLTRERLQVLENSLEMAKELLIINREKEKAGFLAKIDILTTEANIAAREESILQVKKSLGNSEDRLKRLLNPDHSSVDWQQTIVPAEKPQFVNYPVNTEKSYQTSLNNRPDFLAVLIDAENTGIEKEIAEQNRLPLLNLNTRGGLESLDRNYGTSVAKLFDFKTYFWNLGFSFEIPVTGNIDETRYQEMLSRLEMQKVVTDNYRQRLLTEVRQAVREIEINEQRVKANRISRELAEEQVKAETEKLNLGLSTNFQVLEFQKKLEEASLNEVNALIDFVKSVNILASVEGVILEKNNIVWDIANETK